MTELGLAIDGLLSSLILWLGWRTLASTSLFQAIVMFVAFGLSMGLAWIRMDAADVALAEIAVGAGLTGALLLAALRAGAGPGDDDGH